MVSTNSSTQVIPAAPVMPGASARPGDRTPLTPRPASVLITGLGVISGYGVGAQLLWAGLNEGPTAVKPIRRVKVGDTPGVCALASEVPAGLSAKDFVPKHYRKAVKVMVRDTELAVIAAANAVSDAKLVTRATTPEAGDASGVSLTYASSRVGCHIGAGLIPAEAPEIGPAFASSIDAQGQFSVRKWGTVATPAEGLEGSGSDPTGGSNGMANLQPLWMLKYLPNMLACHVTILHGAEGPSNTITCGEASGLLCIGESERVIRRGAADACFSGGAEAKVNLMGLARSALRGRLAESGVPQPYNPASPGTVPGEGGGLLMLERSEAARGRGARAYAGIVGFGAAQSLTRGGRNGLALAIFAALKDAGLAAESIDAVVPQALGVPEVDRHEIAALREVFGHRPLPLVTLPPMLGDCSSGGGGLAVSVAALCLHHNTLPAAAIIFTDDAGPANAGSTAPLGAGRKKWANEQHNITHVLVCSGSFSGQNAAVILAKT